MTSPRRYDKLTDRSVIIFGQRVIIRTREAEIARTQSTESVRESRRRQIIKAAQAEFAVRGFYRTEVASIAERAGVSKGTIYNYFDNKESLLIGVVSAGFEQLGERMRTISAEIIDPVDKISRALREYLEFFDRHKGFHKVLLKEAVHILPKVRTEYRTHLIEHVGHLEKLIRQGIASKEFARIDPQLAALVLLDMVGAVTKGSILINRRFNVDQDHKTIMRIFLHGIKKK